MIDLIHSLPHDACGTLYTCAPSNIEQQAASDGDGVGRKEDEVAETTASAAAMAADGEIGEQAAEAGGAAAVAASGGGGAGAAEEGADGDCRGSRGVSLPGALAAATGVGFAFRLQLPVAASYRHMIVIDLVPACKFFFFFFFFFLYLPCLLWM